MKRVMGYDFGCVGFGAEIEDPRFLVIMAEMKPAVYLDLGDKQMAYPFPEGMVRTAKQFHSLCQGEAAEDEYKFMIEAIKNKDTRYGKIDKVLMNTGEERVEEIIAFPNKGVPQSLRDGRTAVMTKMIWDSKFYVDGARVDEIRCLYPAHKSVVLLSMEKPLAIVEEFGGDDILFFVKEGLVPSRKPADVPAYTLSIFMKECYEKGYAAFPKPDSLVFYCMKENPVFRTCIGDEEYAFEPINALLLAKISGCNEVYISDDAMEKMHPFIHEKD